MLDFDCILVQLGMLVLAAATVVLVGLFIYMYMTTVQDPDIYRYENEMSFTNPKTKEKVKFASVFDPPTVNLSIIVPAYNEEQRMPAMLNEAIEHLEERISKNKNFTYEVIIVDDGSKDDTSSIGMMYSEKYGCDKVRVLTLQENRGKGGAIKRGVLSARGERILFADADGATTFADFDKVDAEMSKLLKGSDEVVVCGSRAHLEDEAIAQRSFFRTILMKGFHFLVWFLCVRGVRDTQCGFKLMSRRAAQKLFTSLHIDRWAFDVELLYIAQCLGMTLGEVAVRWQEIEGSKLTPFWSWLQMGRDLLFIRLRYVVGLWKIETKSE